MALAIKPHESIVFAGTNPQPLDLTIPKGCRVMIAPQSARPTGDYLEEIRQRALAPTPPPALAWTEPVEGPLLTKVGMTPDGELAIFDARDGWVPTPTGGLVLFAFPRPRGPRKLSKAKRAAKARAALRAKK